MIIGIRELESRRDGLKMKLAKTERRASDLESASGLIGEVPVNSGCGERVRPRGRLVPPVVERGHEDGAGETCETSFVYTIKR